MRIASPILLAIMAWYSEAQGDVACDLCENGDIPARLDFRVEGDGTTCTDLYVDMAFSVTNAASCMDLQSRYRETCCGSEEPEEVPLIPTPSPVIQGSPGEYPLCDVCRGGEFPGRTNSALVILRFGTYTCLQLYEMGVLGHIPDHYCLPMQDYAQEPCGCGEFHPDYSSEEEQDESVEIDVESTILPTPSPVETPPLNNNRVRRRMSNNKASQRYTGSRGGSAGMMRFLQKGFRF